MQNLINDSRVREFIEDHCEDLERSPLTRTINQQKIVDVLHNQGADGLILTRDIDIRWATGFTGSSSIVIIFADSNKPVIITDERYAQQVVHELASAVVDAEVIIENTDQFSVVVNKLKDCVVIAIEHDHFSLGTFNRLQQKLQSKTFVALAKSMQRLRAHKTESEVLRIKLAAAIADRALLCVTEILSQGPTEQEFATYLDTYMRVLGAQDRSFETIVASGPNSAKPHARPTSRKIRNGDLVVVDFGALVDGYHSDMTRTFLVGEGTSLQQKMLDTVKESQQMGVNSVRLGQNYEDIDKICREVIDQAGWGNAFMHGTGHGVGLEIHEEPRVGSQSVGHVEIGHVFTIEPGVYLSDHGGVRIEDTVVMTTNGAQILTCAPKTSTV